MDYKYITQLVDRYFEGQTTLEEEEILRAFFSQEDVPESLLPYRSLFAYEAKEVKEDILDDGFDEKVMEKIGDLRAAKPRAVTMRQRLMPLFKSAAVVAIFLTLGLAAQMPYRESSQGAAPQGMQIMRGASTAVNDDSTLIDTLQQGSIGPQGLDGTATTIQ